MPHTDDFDRLVDLLNSSPEEECVITEQFLDELHLTESVKESADKIARISQRTVRKAIEFAKGANPGVELKVHVFVFSVKGS